MVKILKRPPVLEYLKYVYDKPLNEKLRYLWGIYQKVNPTLGYYGIPVTIGTLGLMAVVSYLKCTRSGRVPKYYQYYCVMRPDDPRVPTLRKDDSLGVHHTFAQRKLYALL